MSYLKSYLKGFENLVKAKSDLERLRHMPQKLENGELINFNGKSLVGKVESLKDSGILEVIDAERVNDASRYTAALQKEYFDGFTKLIKIIEDAEGDVTNNVDEQSNEPSLEDRIIEIVEAGDKKAFRSIRQELKDAWFAVGDSEVADALIDLSDAVADKDVEFAKEILEGLGDTPVIDEKQSKTNKGSDVENPKEVDDDSEQDEDDELLADFNDAVEDEDAEDCELILKEMKEKNHPKLKECEKIFSDKFGAATFEKEPADEEGDVVNEILDDLDDAFDDKDLDKCKKLLDELKEEVDEDDEDLLEYMNKVSNLDKELNGSDDTPRRRRRRG